MTEQEAKVRATRHVGPIEKVLWGRETRYRVRGVPRTLTRPEAVEIRNSKIAIWAGRIQNQPSLLD